MARKKTECRFQYGLSSFALGALLVGAGFTNAEVVSAEEPNAVSVTSEVAQEESNYIDSVDTNTDVLTGQFYPDVTIRIELSTENFPSFTGLGTVTTDAEGNFAFELPEDVSLSAGDQLRFHGQHRYFNADTFSFEVIVLDETITVTQGVDPAVEAARETLNDLIEAVSSEYDEAVYTEESWEAFEAAVDAAVSERDNPVASVESLQNVAEALEQAVEDLVTLEEAVDDLRPNKPGKPSWTPGRGPRKNPGKPSWTPGRGPRENPGKPSWTPGRGPR